MNKRLLANFSLSSLLIVMGISCAPQAAMQPKNKPSYGVVGKNRADQEALVQKQLAEAGRLRRPGKKNAAVVPNVLSASPERKVEGKKRTRLQIRPSPAEAGQWRHEDPVRSPASPMVMLSDTVRHGLHSGMNLKVFREQQGQMLQAAGNQLIAADRKTKLFIDDSDLQMKGAVLDRLRSAEMSYWLTAVAFEAKKTTEKTFVRSQMLMTEAENRQRRGAISEPEVLQARNFLAAQRSARTRAERRFQQARGNLESVAGVTPGNDRVYQSLVSFDHVIPNPGASFRNAQKGDSDLILITNEMRHRHHSVGLYPSSSGKRSLDQVLNPESPLAWDDLFALSQPILNHGNRFGMITADLESGSLSSQILRTKLKGDINRLCRIIEGSKVSLKQAAGHLIEQRTVWTKQENEFRSGKISIAQMIEGEKALEKARLKVLDELAHVIAPQVMLAYMDGSLMKRHGIRW